MIHSFSKRYIVQSVTRTKWWLLPQLAADSGDFVIQQDGAPPHWNMNVRRYINDELPHR
jgi:hypothetical protein